MFKTQIHILKSRLLFGILLMSASNPDVNTISAAPATPADRAHALEVIRNKHDLPALAMVVVKDGQICDRAAVGVRRSDLLDIVASGRQYSPAVNEDSIS